MKHPKYTELLSKEILKSHTTETGILETFPHVLEKNIHTCLFVEVLKSKVIKIFHWLNSCLLTFDFCIFCWNYS